MQLYKKNLSVASSWQPKKAGGHWLILALLVAALVSPFWLTSVAQADSVATAESTLIKQNWYISDAVKTSLGSKAQATQQTLQNTVNDLKNKKHPGVLALLDPSTVKSGFTNADSYAEYLRSYISPKPDIVVVAVIAPSGSGTSGVALAADKLSQDEQKAITDAARSTFTTGDYGGAMRQIALAAEKKIADSETGSSLLTAVIALVVIAAIGGGIAFLLISTKNNWKRQLDQLQNLNGQVSDLVVRVSDGIDYLPDATRNTVRDQFGQATANMSNAQSGLRELKAATPIQLVLSGGKYRQQLSATSGQLQTSLNLLQPLDRAVEKA